MGIGLRALLLALAIAANLGGPAAAGSWYKAETDRFVVYGEQSETRVREYAQKLHTFDMLLRIYHPSTLGKVPPTKLQVVLVSGPNEMRRVHPRVTDTTLGLYAPNNEGVFAFVIPSRRFGRDDVLFHEYAHHFMLENFPAAYPAWLVEGFAEYFATVDIQAERVRVGEYNEARVSWILGARWLSMDELLGKLVSAMRGDDLGVYYAQAWLFTHYMRSDPVRARQLDTAIKAIAAGQEPVKAVTEATGQTTAELFRALKNYRSLPIKIFTGPDLVKPAEVKVTVLPPSADDLLLDHLRLIYSSASNPDPAFMASVRRKAARWPDDSYAQMTLARAEFVMGDPAAGEAIVKRLLSAHPDDKELLLLAAMGDLFTGDRKKEERVARYRAARAQLMKVYDLDDEDFRPLYAYARTRMVEPTYPSDRDIEALAETRRLARAVKETSLLLGQALLRRDRREEAEGVLSALVNDPHGSGYAKAARALLDGKLQADVEAEEADGS